MTKILSALKNIGLILAGAVAIVLSYTLVILILKSVYG
jgi:hypothetical protein